MVDGGEERESPARLRCWGWKRLESVWMTFPMRCLWMEFKSSPGDDVEESCRNQPCLSSHPRQVPVEVNSVAEFNLGGGVSGKLILG